MAFVQPDICYDSPIDGRPITSRQARADDLARSGCIPYDPEMKTDAMHRRKESEEALMISARETIREEIARMDCVKRDRLAAEMEGGIDATIIRT